MIELRKAFTWCLALCIPVLFLSAGCCWSDDREYTLVFTGDILLSREVTREVNWRKRVSPWRDMHNLLSSADWVMGNLEGAVGETRGCQSGNTSADGLCFPIALEDVAFLSAAGFDALGVENNHSGDLGADGRAVTADALRGAGLMPISWSDSPRFFRLGSYTIAVVALSEIAAKDGRRVEVPSPELRQKISLARALANWVVVFPHWGRELEDWPSESQRRDAQWLIEEGADIVVGHHPHVVQAPECVSGRPVFFSLGNHVFDQKYPETKKGLLASCRIANGALTCGGLPTETPMNSSFPHVASGAQEAAQLPCGVFASKTLAVNGVSLRPRRQSQERFNERAAIEGSAEGAPPFSLPNGSVVTLQRAHFDAPPAAEMLFALERHRSTIDGERAIRPYVYSLTPRGPLARWRGSALAWPLIDATLLSDDKGIDVVCALHRADSFLAMNEKTLKTRTAVYRWNGFGFSGVSDERMAERCRDAFAQSAPPAGR